MADPILPKAPREGVPANLDWSIQFEPDETDAVFFVETDAASAPGPYAFETCTDRSGRFKIRNMKIPNEQFDASRLCETS